ncbi:MAG: hypothetical protein M3010_03460 [Candidatus Dormibacteraeota bacterium]|nr:hypothetical protein [Candidatus Dormibacteraeota bacterium]
MPRRYKPITLPLRPTPEVLVEQTARCPNCEERGAVSIGRLGLRLVFQCPGCRVRFYRVASTSTNRVA